MKTPIKNLIHIVGRKMSVLGLTTMFMVFLSCSNDDVKPEPSAEEKESTTLDAEDDYYFQDVDEIALAAFSIDDETGGRVATDTRLTGAVVLHVGTSTNGTLTIDFGAGTTDAHGNVRKGTIILVHSGRWNELGAQWTITFSGYSINGITLGGTRKVTVIAVTDSSITHDVELLDGKIVWVNGQVATRSYHHIRECEYDVAHVLKRLIVYGNAQGTLRNGRGFSIEITEELVYDRACAEDGVFIAVKGKKVIKHGNGNHEVTIDYGDGTCDNIVTLTNKAGFSVRYEVSK